MKCPKCHSEVQDNQAICPVCHKLLLLECPNCHELGESSHCAECGYTILVKCLKCSKINHINSGKCSKCGFPVKASLAANECETDEFAMLNVSFGGLKEIKKKLKTKELYSKFNNKLKNLLNIDLKNVEGKIIKYDNEVCVNFNKELSFATSANKAVRLALKIINTFVELNLNVIKNFDVPLDLTISIYKKTAEELQENIKFKSNVKQLTVSKKSQKYLKGMKIVLDQYVSDEVSKEYSVDSLYSVEKNGMTLMLYEILLDAYVLPPAEKEEDPEPKAVLKTIKKEQEEKDESDLYSFKVFDINAKCNFVRTDAVSLMDKISELDLSKNGKIITIRAPHGYEADINEIIDLYGDKGFRVLTVSCTKDMAYRPWGVFIELFKTCYNLPFLNKFIDLNKIDANSVRAFKPIFELINNKAVNAMSPEDARYAYMEIWSKFLASLKGTVVVIDGFENLDDTSLQTLEIYFDNYKKVVPNFVFLNSMKVAVHAKIRGLLRTSIYTEFTLGKTPMDICMSTIKADATNFIESFYFEKIQENYSGSYLFFKNAIMHLKENNILVEFENKLIIQNSKSIVIPKDIDGLYRARMKYLGKSQEISFILAYCAILGARLDVQTLSSLGNDKFDEALKTLLESKLLRADGDIIYVDNYNTITELINKALKPEAAEFLSKNILAQIGKGLEDYLQALIMGRLHIDKEEYLTLWKTSQFAISVGDYDAYLKNCLKFLSLVENINADIDKETVEENKLDVYNNILMFLYNYSPAKIYFIENVLLMDAIEAGDNDKIIKLSNLMLQGALISANYTDALGLLHNILIRMKSPTLIADGEINVKFLLLSLVNIEILYNIGDFKQCVELAEEILNVLNPETIEKVKPASFSINLFVNHILDTLRLAGFAKLYVLDSDLDVFFEKIQNTMKTQLPEQDCILAIRDYLAGKMYKTENVEEYSPFSKIIFLILQEFVALTDDYKRFAQNIYQAKLLASDIHQRELELFCDLMIAYAYSKIGIKKKALAIYRDVLATAEKDAVFNILAAVKYLIAKLKFESGEDSDGMLLINDSLAMIRKYDNQSQIFFALFEKLFIDVRKSNGALSEEYNSEILKLVPLKERLYRLVGDISNPYEQVENTPEAQTKEAEPVDESHANDTSKADEIQNKE